MGFCMAYCFAKFMMILMIHVIICPVNGQCCDNKDQLLSIVDAIQQLRDELLHRLDKQDQSISKAADRCPLERDICREQLRSVFNESFLELKNQHDAILTSLQAVDRRLEEHEISIRNQIQKSQTFANAAADSVEVRLNIIGRTATQSSNYVHYSINLNAGLAIDGIYNPNVDAGSCSHTNDNASGTSWWRVDLGQPINVKRIVLLNRDSLGTSDRVTHVRDCSDIKASGHNRSGVYEVCVGDQPNRVCSNAFCNMEATNRASLVFQRRKDGSVLFNRTWVEYRDGFGNPDGEFWLGNEMLSLLTSKRRYKLRVDLEDWEGAKRYAEYSTFSINSSDTNYTLTVGGYSGNAGDSMSYNNGRQFTTIDVDNDDYPLNCAWLFHGAWWHGGCSLALLNGKYFQRYDRVLYGKGIHWYHWRDGVSYSLKAAEMKLVPVA